MIYFIDLDGVIIDSAKECYLVSKFVYYKNKKFSYDEDKYSKLFYKYRGLVGPAGGFELDEPPPLPAWATLSPSGGRAMGPPLTPSGGQRYRAMGAPLTGIEEIDRVRPSKLYNNL